MALTILLIRRKATRPATSGVAALRAAIRGREIIHSSGRHLYAYYSDGIGESKLTVSLIERKLKTCSTGRNWNTILKIQASAAN